MRNFFFFLMEVLPEVLPNQFTLNNNFKPKTAIFKLYWFTLVLV